MNQLSLEHLRSAVYVLSLSSLAMAFLVYLLMEIQHRRHLTREVRRIMLANKLGLTLDEDALRALWTASGRADREIIEDILVAQRRLPDPGRSGAAENAALGAGIHGAWIKQLREGRVSRRVRAAAMLGHFRDQRGVEALGAAAEDPSPQVALAVAISLGRLGDPRGMPGLMRLTKQPRRVIPDLTLAAALAACARGQPTLLAELLKAPEVRLRSIAAWALSEVADPTVLPELLLAARDAEPEVRAKVARALSHISAPEAVDALSSMARDPVWFVRVRALDALGRLRDLRGEPAALAGLADPVREVRNRAASALRQIGGMKSAVMAKVLATGSRRSFECLLSEWERGGFLERVVAQLAGRDWAKFAESQEFVKTLIAAGVTRALVNFVLVFPDIKVRLRLLRLLAQAPRPVVREALLAVAARPQCDRRVAAAIRARIAPAGSPPPVEEASRPA